MIMCLFVSPESTQAYQNRGNEPTSKSEAGYHCQPCHPKAAIYNGKPTQQQHYYVRACMRINFIALTTTRWTTLCTHTTPYTVPGRPGDRGSVVVCDDDGHFPPTLQSWQGRVRHVSPIKVQTGECVDRHLTGRPTAVRPALLCRVYTLWC